MKIRLIRLMYISQKLTAQRTVKPHRDVRAVRQERTSMRSIVQLIARKQSFPVVLRRSEPSALRYEPKHFIRHTSNHQRWKFESNKVYEIQNFSTSLSFTK